MKKRSKFNLSYTVAQTMNMGALTPIGITEVLPGDTFQHATQAMIRVAPLNAPVMHPTRAQICHFFVPHRLVWDDWEDFITRGPDGDSAPVFPTITLDSDNANEMSFGSLANCLGVPATEEADFSLEVSALPFRAYALIFNEYFRDQDLVTPLVIDTTSGPDTTTNKLMQQAAWEKDYFTSSRDFTQKGPEVIVPILGDAPVRGIGLVDGQVGAAPASYTVRQSGDTVTSAFTGWEVEGSSGAIDADEARIAIDQATTLGYPDIYADLASASGVDVNELRLALGLQRFEEARARWGSRYTEYLRYLGVMSSDARLQRPEYLGGGKQTIQYSEVLQTAEGAGGTGVGNLFGHGIAALQSNRYRRFFEEHGYVISFLIVRPKAIYMDGLFRHWNRRTFTDFWQPEVEHVGQQAVLNKEVWAFDVATPNGTFGYQDRYDEYRRNESRVCGEFASTLNYWTQARTFSALPDLNADFVNCVPSTEIFQSEDTAQLYVMIYHSMQARRLIAKSGTSFIF